MDVAGSQWFNQALGLTFVRTKPSSSAGRKKRHHCRLRRPCSLYTSPCTTCYAAIVVGPPCGSTRWDEGAGLSATQPSQLAHQAAASRRQQASASPRLVFTVRTPLPHGISSEAPRRHCSPGYSLHCRSGPPISIQGPP
ncbi:hypothetical protein NDU88_003990 [Pleurodeles waltl]|uniref:Uncharacterized protein n=1 Tax=Pleurodeles waltl TaxID=8319 RepID=A0AAV7T7J1_PLEWA|nr:hypothetical protein NDU88_003990 [Pleurodeles waltl]